MYLLLRFYDPDEGEILLDGTGILPPYCHNTIIILPPYRYLIDTILPPYYEHIYYERIADILPPYYERTDNISIPYR